MEDYIEINIADKFYPDQLREINNSPQKLFMRGNLEILRKKYNCSSWLKKLYKLWICFGI